MMRKVDAQSGSACHSSLEFFSVKPTNVSIQRYIVKEVLPLSHESPFEFRFVDGVRFSHTYGLDFFPSKTFSTSIPVIYT